MNKHRCLILAAVVAVTGATVLAQNLPGFKIKTRLAYTVSPSTNAVPTLISSNVPGLVRGWLMVQNTNGATAAIYVATNGTPVAVLYSGATFAIQWPTVDGQDYYGRFLDSTSRPLIISEGWGQ